MAREKNKSKGFNKEADIQGMTEKIDNFLKENNYDKAHQNIDFLLKKYETDDAVKDRVNLYVALKDTITSNK